MIYEVQGTQKQSLRRMICILLLINIIRTDLPVHCLAKDIKGEWILIRENDLKSNQQSCGHEHPDKNTDHIFSPFKVQTQSTKQKVELVFPDKVVQDDKVVGRWTMVYDEGFELFMDSGENYFAFSKYTISNTVKPKDDDDEKSEGYMSNCKETFIGWYRDSYDKWGCFYAIKQDSKTINQNKIMKLLQATKSEKVVERDDLLFKKVDNQQQGLGLYDKFQQNQNIYQIPHSDFNQKNQNDNIFEQDYSFIELINDVNVRSPWKAKAHEQFNQKTQKQMKQLIGMTDAKQYKYDQIVKQTQKYDQTQNQSIDQVFLQEKQKINFKNILKSNTKQKQKQRLDNEQNKQMKSQEVNQKINEICRLKYSNGLGRCYDWRNINDTNYDTPIKRQGDCGSCYSVALLSALESRIRIKSGNRLQPILSNSNMISCSRYNQGCNGGYPYLVAKQGMEFGFATEDCQPNKENDQECIQKCLNPIQTQVYNINKYGYVGKDYYGSTNEYEMMKEIMTNGPIVVALNASPDLYYYSEGVFITNPTDNLKQSNDDDQVAGWMFTNHAVVCIGWGETIHQGKIMKYWILKNSWGEEWGENGYFKMLRGVNLGAIENQATYVIPSL